MEVRYHDSVNVLQEMFAARDTGDDASSPFQRPHWFKLLEEAGHSPFIVTAQQNGETIALPLQREGSRLVPLRNWYSFTWRPLKLGSESTLSFLTALALELRKQTHRVTLSQVPDEDESATQLAKAFADAGWRVEVSQCDINHVLSVKGRSFAEYWASRPGPLRTTLKRKAKKVSVTILDRFDPAIWSDYEAIYSKSWKPTEGEPQMLTDFAKAEGAAGRLRLGIAHHKGEPIAAQFWTVEDGTAYIHKLAHLESCRHLSAGTTLSAALFEWVIDVDKVALVDFGTGNEPYKSDWMEATRKRYQIDCIDLRQARGWLDLTRLALSRSRSATIPALARTPTQS